MLRNELINKIIISLDGMIDPHVLSNILHIEMADYEITEKSKNELIEYNQTEDQKAFQMFFVSKKVEGCTDRTIGFYEMVMKKFVTTIVKPFSEITKNDIRYYLAIRATRDKVSKVTQDNERRVLSSFFAWLTANEYICKNPMLSIKAVKKEKKVKKPFTDEEIEKIRMACKNNKTRAMVEFLLSTGCRAGEIQSLKLEDINLSSGSLIVFGKGKKEREVFINAKAKYALDNYLEERGNPKKGPLFESATYKGKSITIAGVEIMIRKLGESAGVDNCHPHRFRRTMATLALNRGMQIDQVQIMLGHESISTTTLYAISDKESVKHSHKKYVY